MRCKNLAESELRAVSPAQLLTNMQKCMGSAMQNAAHATFAVACSFKYFTSKVAPYIGSQWTFPKILRANASPHCASLEKRVQSFIVCSSRTNTCRLVGADRARHFTNSTLKPPCGYHSFLHCAGRHRLWNKYQACSRLYATEQALLVAMFQCLGRACTCMD